jgi:hypothetical protein
MAMTEGSLAEDAELLRSWWGALLRTDPPSTETRALWFGLFEDSYGGTTLYVQGYPEFDADDETAEWATVEPSWAPDGRYVRLPVLVRAQTWEEALGSARRLLDELGPQTTWPGRLDGIAAGYDDGDAHLIWAASD